MIFDGINRGVVKWIANIVCVILTSLLASLDMVTQHLCKIVQQRTSCFVSCFIVITIAAIYFGVRCVILRKKLANDFHKHLKLVEDTGYYIDKRNNKPVCPKCLANSRLCYLRCEKRIDWITRQTYTQVSCLCDQHESLDRIYGDPFELDNGSLYRIDFAIIYSTPEDIKNCYGTSVEELKKHVPQ